MAELSYDRTSSRSTFRGGARDASPDSVIFTLESNFSLFSSASASVDRCSFASDAHDRDSIVSEISLQLLANENGGENALPYEASSGPQEHNKDLDPNKVRTKHAHSRHLKNFEKAKISKRDKDKEDSDNNKIELLLEEDDTSHQQLIDSARNSFSIALKECQERRSRSEVVSKKLDRRRPASLDLNNVLASAVVSSPRLNAMKKSAVTSRKSAAAGGNCNFPSPGTPNYHRPHQHANAGVLQKGWSSERVPLHNNSNRRQVTNANNSNVLLLPGRTLPSKWEDAERWIFSPVSGDGSMRNSVQAAQQRRPKSKSGPLGPPGVAYYSLYSPAVPVFDGVGMGNFMGGSPFSAGVIAADGMSGRSNGSGIAFPVRNELARSVSVHGCSETAGQSSSRTQDEKLDTEKDPATDLSSVSRRDMATQMSPEGSNHSSPSLRPSFSESTPCALPIVEVQSVHSSNKSEIRDVQVDERVTVTRWSKKHRSRNHGKSSEIPDEWRKKSVDGPSCAWDVSEATKIISKSKREEAKITAWENLQKAKAEAAIRKLEMKLEKKRASSMDKIMSKLRSAQKKAQEMRSSVSINQSHQVSRAPQKAILFSRTRQMGSLSGCFTCHAF